MADLYTEWVAFVTDQVPPEVRMAAWFRRSIRLDTDAIPKPPTYKQDWPAYNEAQATQKHRFEALLADLSRGLEEPPPPKTGRRPHSVRDRIFAMAFKVYGTFSGRRSSCDLKDAHAKGYLSKPISGVKVSAFFEDATLTPTLHTLIAQSSLPLRAVETSFVPDSTGFSTSRFVRWYDEKYGIERSGKDWVKAHAMCGTKTNIVTAVVVGDRDAADCPQFPELLSQTAKNFTVKEVPADKAYLSHDNLKLVENLGGTAYVPFKSNSVPGEASSLWEKAFLYYSLHRDEFLKHYHQRSNAEINQADYTSSNELYRGAAAGYSSCHGAAGISPVVPALSATATGRSLMAEH